MASHAEYLRRARIFTVAFMKEVKVEFHVKVRH
jgi:hypothetical protein